MHRLCRTGILALESQPSSAKPGGHFNSQREGLPHRVVLAHIRHALLDDGAVLHLAGGARGVGEH